MGTTTINSKKDAPEEREELYIDTAEAEHINEYTKGIPSYSYVPKYYSEDGYCQTREWVPPLSN